MIQPHEYITGEQLEEDISNGDINVKSWNKSYDWMYKKDIVIKTKNWEVPMYNLSACIKRKNHV
jgi:hypothetical protein